MVFCELVWAWCGLWYGIMLLLCRLQLGRCLWYSSLFCRTVIYWGDGLLILLCYWLSFRQLQKMLPTLGLELWWLLQRIHDDDIIAPLWIDYEGMTCLMMGWSWLLNWCAWCIVRIMACCRYESYGLDVLCHGDDVVCYSCCHCLWAWLHCFEWWSLQFYSVDYDVG